MPPTVSKTADQAAITLTRGGDSWTGDYGKPAEITFGFRETGIPVVVKPGVDLKGTFSKMNAMQISAVTLALDLWSDLARIEFQRVGTGAA